nr:succinate dehydrogenase cytochrome b556 subunit [Providencia sp. wls1914]
MSDFHPRSGGWKIIKSCVGKIVKKQRPVNLDLQTIHFPITAISSILHRVSGVITLIAVGILLWLLGTSLSSPEGFQYASEIMTGFFAKFILWGILTALAYHICGGIRHMLMDFGCVDETLASGNSSAKITFVITVILAILAGILVW